MIKRILLVDYMYKVEINNQLKHINKKRYNDIENNKRTRASTIMNQNSLRAHTIFALKFDLKYFVFLLG